jgi:ATP-dependent DNA helicase RecG
MELFKIRGINEKRNAELNKAGICDTADLIRCFPKNYLDLREKRMLSYAYHNDIVLTVAKVIVLPPVRYYKHGVGTVKAVCEQDGLSFNIIWFNQPYVIQKLKEGEEYLFYGRVRKEGNAIMLVNPTFEPCDKAFRLKGIVPHYQIKGGIPQKVLRDAVRLSVDLEKPQSIIPESIQRKYGLMNLYSAYKTVHNPLDFNALSEASSRIAIEEYFCLISAYKTLYGGNLSVRTNKYACSAKELKDFITQNFPFEFTDGQKNAVNEIFADMKGEYVMNRLLQGDVGSGKTAVSSVAIYIALSSGYQVSMLSPTEVLAKQNYNVIKNLFESKKVELLIGSLTAKEKKSIKERLKNGEIDVLVGTHAILTEDVEFKNLALCVCDEQQRFGVAQRSAMLNKGVAPDVLVMSATPIPRTLALIFYGDLAITTIRDKPKNRQEIQTNIVPMEKYNDMLGFIKREVNCGHQAYLVCPRIEGDEDGEIESAKEIFESLKQKMPDICIGLLHGKLKEKEKTAVMQDFKNGEYKILVSTTVIEVGVDVPNASVMVIYNAERFGLSQLHQLRGRVGRSDIKSYCFLLTSTSSETAIERLKVIKSNTDGFKISEADYKLRGSGDFMGVRQSGKMLGDLGYLNFKTECIFLAKKISDEAFEKGENLDKIKAYAKEKYEKLKDIALN